MNLVKLDRGEDFHVAVLDGGPFDGILVRVSELDRVLTPGVPSVIYIRVARDRFETFPFELVHWLDRVAVADAAA